MNLYGSIPILERSSERIIETALRDDERLLLFGEIGSGKSTIALDLAHALLRQERNSFIISADPGSPPFGLPGAVSLARFDGDGLLLIRMEALCSLDAARFRMPLVSAVGRLVPSIASGPLILDAPGVARGVAGAEMLYGLVETADIDVALILVRRGEPLPLLNELRALPAKVFVVEAADEAHRPTKPAREKTRTKLWNEHLKDADERVYELEALNLLGTPPPLDIKEAWVGRQAAFLDERQNTLAFAEVIAMEKRRIRVKTTIDKSPSALLVRDAQRDERGFLATARLLARELVKYAPPPDMCSPPEYAHVIGPRPVGHVGSVSATLVNGVFGDPLLHLRMRREKRSVLFDLGEAGRLPARIAHQVSDVFISHAHIDHIGGFIWLLRSRIGYLPTCRIFGPPGVSENILGMIRGVLWDRIGDRGPRFEVSELRGDKLTTRMIEAGRNESESLGERIVKDGVLLDEPDFLVRAVTLDHRTPSLAFSFETPIRLNVRKEMLNQKDRPPPGPWLAELKKRVFDNDRDSVIEMPDGRKEKAGRMADELLIVSPGEKLVYAVDFGDTPENRMLVENLARGAHTFFCEAAFAEADADQAEKYHHLTTRACGEIANAAGVERLIPFHFSKRYEKDPEPIYQEIEAVCHSVAIPKIY